MQPAAQLSIADMRHDRRRSVDRTVSGEHRWLGDVNLRLTDLSRLGTMVAARSGIERGDRVVLHLPNVGRIEALCLWTRYQKAGLQFERPLYRHEIEGLIAAMAPQESRTRVD